MIWMLEVSALVNSESGSSEGARLLNGNLLSIC